MPDRQRIGLVFGGRSVEHEVSVVSAQHVIAAADAERFEVVPLGVTRQGVWLTPDETSAQLAKGAGAFKTTLVAPESDAATSLASAIESLRRCDVIFPLIHGTHGEDGTLQGLLELLDLPYVGCGVAASAAGMDKAIMKSVFRGAGIAVGDYVVLDAADCADGSMTAVRLIEERLGYPCFVKPANGGSSVGISKARSREDLSTALAEASRHDRKLVIEAAVVGREVECAVLGNADAKASPIGEIRYTREFYDYEAKYLDAGTQIIAPADLPEAVADQVRELALHAFRAIDGAGLSRVDFFLRDDGSLLIDEINTMPGFTPTSMFPRLWQTAGLGYSELITRLVDFALARHKEKRIA